MEMKTQHINLWYAPRAVLMEKYIAPNVLNEHLNDLSFFSRKLEKGEEIKFKLSRRKELIKIKIGNR